MSFDLKIDFDFDAFEAEVYAAARIVFSKLQRDYSSETFYTFNLVTGDVSQYVTVFVNTEEELTRQASEYKLPPGIDLPLVDRRFLLRHSLHTNKFTSGVTGNEIENEFEKATALLLALQSQLEEQEDLLIEDEGIDEDEFDDILFDSVHEPIADALKRVMQRLDQEGVFVSTNARENVHLGVLSAGDRGELMGPFADLNPPATCNQYVEDQRASQRASSMLANPKATNRGCRWFGLF